MKISVGLSKKVGQPNFGSLGASCQIEVELNDNEYRNEHRNEYPGSALQLQTKISQAFCICKAAVENELAIERRFQQQVSPPPSDASRASDRRNSNAGAASDDRQPNPIRNATAAQKRALGRIASAAQVDLISHAEREFGVQSIEQLTIRQASALIDRLKALLKPAAV
ncbi:MAG TPA: hypothetical protein DDZ51_19485 [Planctomycetaceae bacterium]|nr:hypothetical protein [Planctomycetaceae bacterium]